MGLPSSAVIELIQAEKKMVSPTANLFQDQGRKVTYQSKQSLRSCNRNLALIFSSLVVDLIAFSSILPLFPKIIASYTANQNEPLVGLISQSHRLLTGGLPVQSSSIVVLMGGFLGSIFCLGQFVTAPIAGMFADRWGRKPVYIASLIGISFSYFVWLVSTSFTGFVISRILGGMWKSNVSVALAMVSDVTSTANRTRGMALVGIAFSVGFTVGPLVGAFMATKEIKGFHPSLQDLGLFNSYSAAALFALCLSLMNVAGCLLFLPETMAVDEKTRKTKTVTQSMAESFVLPTHMFSSRNSRLNVINMVYFSYMFLFSGLEFTLSFLTHDKFNYSNKEQGKLYFFIGIVMALCQGGIARRMKRGRESAVAKIGLLVLLPAFLLIGRASREGTVYVGCALFCLGSALVVPSLTGLTSLNSGQSAEGECMGVFRSTGSLARAISPLLACLLYWKLGAEMSFSVFAVLFVVPFAILCRLKELHPSAKVE